METCAACICAQASSLAQECWHQVCSPDRQLHCSGVFNMPHQDPSLLDPLSLNKIRVREEIRAKLHCGGEARRKELASLNLSMGMLELKRLLNFL